MNKAITVFLTVLVLLFLSVSCSSDGSVDEVFNCTITFNGNGATEGEMSVQTVGIGKESRLSANAYERTQHLFKGWNTEADGSGTAFTDGQRIKTTDNITLYAQWEIVPIILNPYANSWTDGNVYTLNSSITIDRVHVFGNVTLILNDGCTLTVSNGITVREERSLTIGARGEGTGILEAAGIFGTAGIGGELGESCGTIIINGGTVNASGTGGGAGIGGGYMGSGGTIIINGGTVNASAKGVGSGAGIGGGFEESGGVITINGGTVEASAEDGGAGIGGGSHGSGGTIIINGGTVNASAKGVGSGAGIGGGFEESGGVITINGGTVEASTEKGGTGIGRGQEGTDDGVLTLGEGVALEVSSNNTDWLDYDGTRKKYMRTK